MFNILNRLFGSSEDPDTPSLNGNKELSVALAAILTEIATVDGQFSQSEKELIVDILQKEFGLSQEESKEIEDLANTELNGSIDLWHFTNLINENYSNEKKTKIMEYIWKIIYTDTKLNDHEDYLVHKLSRLLNLPHSQLIETKLRVKNQQSAKSG
jgi:uncharacterized tellurite resistance protein B-like protein